MKNAIISFIGAGRMAESLISGLIAFGCEPNKIWASEPHLQRNQELEKKYSIHITTDNQTAAQQAEVLILAVKPQTLKTVAQEIAPLLQKKSPLIISIAAGVREKDLRQWFGENAAIVRCMPNTPALIQSGATALYANPNVTVDQKSLAESILRAVGITVWVENEDLLDIVTALSGSGPAYFFLVMEALEKAAIEMGLPSDTAHLLTLQTALGSARMALESAESLHLLRQHVTSPGGTTEQAIKVLETNGIEDLFKQAIQAGVTRGQELGKLFV